MAPTDLSNSGKSKRLGLTWQGNYEGIGRSISFRIGDGLATGEPAVQRFDYYVLFSELGR